MEFVPNGEQGHLNPQHIHSCGAGEECQGLRCDEFLLNSSKSSFLILFFPPTLSSHYGLISSNPSKMDQIVKKGRILKFKTMKLVTVV